MIRFGWGDDRQSFLVFCLDGHWTVEEFTAAIAGLDAMAEENFQSVSLLVDLRHSCNPPLDILRHIAAGAYLKSAKINRFIVISSKPLWKRLSQSLSMIYEHIPFPQLVFVTTVDEAYQRVLAAQIA